MSNEDVRNGFTEVYNDFWNRYKDRVPDKDSQEWERIRTRVVVLGRKYPFLKEAVQQMEVELDQRTRGGTA